MTPKAFWIASVGSVLLLLGVPAVMAGLGGIGYRAQTGDGVRFHVTASDVNGTIVYTSVMEKARALMESGRTDVHPLNDTAAYEPYGTTLYKPGERRPGLPEDGTNLDDHLHGRKVGDVVRTPPLDHPFGQIQKEGYVEAHVGPFQTSLVLERARIEASLGAEREHLTEELGSVEDPQPGREFLYADHLPARITDVTDSQVFIDYDAVEGARIFSKVYGFHFIVHDEGNDLMSMDADVSPGEIIYTVKCRSPDGQLRPGNYRVTGFNETVVHLEGAILSPEDNMLGKTLSLELEIVEIEGPDYWQRLGSYLSWLRP